jgi:hypothetical protein
MIVAFAISKSEITFNELNMTCVVSDQTILVAANITINKVGPCDCSMAGAGKSSGPMEITVMYKDVAFGTLQMPPMYVKAGHENHQRVEAQALKITNDTIWNEASTDLLLLGSVKWRLYSSAKVTPHMGISFVFDDIPFDKEVQIQGFNSFASDMKAKNVDMTGVTNGMIDLTLETEVTNPSIVSMSLGPLNLELWTQSGDDGDDVKLGTVHLDDFTLNGNAQGTAITVFPNVQASFIPRNGMSVEANASRAFLSNWLQGKSQSVSIRGSAESTSMSHMKAAMAKLKTNCAVAGLVNHNLLLISLMHLPEPFDPLALPTQLVIQNPFSTNFTWVHSHCDVTACKRIRNDHCDEYFDKPLGYYTPLVIDELIEANSPRHVLQIHPVQLSNLLSPEVIKAFLNSVVFGSFIKLKGVLEISIAGIVQYADYEETDVPICMMYPGHHSCSKNLSNSSNFSSSMIALI